MKNVCFAVSASLSGLLIAGLPLAAQSDDLLTELAHPPLLHVASPASGPTGFGPNHLLVAYSFKDVKDKGKGQTIALVDAYDDPTVEADLGTFSTQFSLPACTTANGCFKLVYAGGKKPPADTTGWSNEVAIDTQWAHAIAPAATIMLVEAQSNSFNDLFSAIDTAVSNGRHHCFHELGRWRNGQRNFIGYALQCSGRGFCSASRVTADTAWVIPAASPYVVSRRRHHPGSEQQLHLGQRDSLVRIGRRREPVRGGTSYQEGVQTTGKRGVPDVAYDGNPNTGIPAYSSHACGACYTGWTQWGGTSIGTPQWAAIFARANSLRVDAGKPTLTVPQTVLYAAPSSDFHDIVSGSNGGCGTRCNAGPGYDFVTGLGSPIGDVLIAKLGGS